MDVFDASSGDAGSVDAINSSTPSCAAAAGAGANNLMLQVELAGGNRAAMTTAVFAQYCAAPIVLTGTLTFIVTMLELYT